MSREPEREPRSLFAPAGGVPSVCPHCWMVNPGPFRLCGRCGADMRTHLQESGGLRRTAPIQSPVPVPGGPPLSPVQRVLVGAFLLVLALSHLVFLVPLRTEAAGTAGSSDGSPGDPAPVAQQP